MVIKINFSEIERIEIWKLFKNGISIRKIAFNFKCSTSPVYRILALKSEYKKVAKKNQSESARKICIAYRRKWTSKEVAIICKKFKRGESLRKIGKEYNASYTSIKGILVDKLEEKEYNKFAKEHQRDSPRKYSFKSRGPTDIEILFTKALIDNNISFTSYFPIPKTHYVGDFLIKGTKLIVECDGYHHYNKKHQETDKIRDKKISNVGYKVIRFWGHEIFENLDNCIQKLKRSLKK